MKVLNFGSANIDRVHLVDHICKAGETISSTKLEIFPGGKGLNQSIALSLAGANAYHAGIIGKDGLFLKELLKTNGVNVTFTKEIDGVTGYAVIQVDKLGENSIILFGGANQQITPSFVDEVLNEFSKGDYIVLQNEINCLKYIIDKAYAKGLKIVLNPSPFNSVLKEIDFNKLTYLILNETEAKDFSGKDSEQEFFEFIENYYPNLHVVLTLGKKGSVYKYKQQLHVQPAFLVNAVDTTGAGDTFAGFFTAEIINGSSPERAMRLASAASSIAVTKKGASSSIPTKKEVLLKLKTLKPSKNDIKTDKQLQVFQNLLNKNYLTLTLKDVSKTLNYSETYAGKWIIKKTGKSFLENLHCKRLEISKELIKTTDLSISEIITKVGYNNAGFFRKIFYKKYGVNPLAMRKNLKFKVSYE